MPYRVINLRQRLATRLELLQAVHYCKGYFLYWLWLVKTSLCQPTTIIIMVVERGNSAKSIISTPNQRFCGETKLFRLTYAIIIVHCSLYHMWYSATLLSLY